MILTKKIKKRYKDSRMTGYADIATADMIVEYVRDKDMRDICGNVAIKDDGIHLSVIKHFTIWLLKSENNYFHKELLHERNVAGTQHQPLFNMFESYLTLWKNNYLDKQYQPYIIHNQEVNYTTDFIQDGEVQAVVLYFYMSLLQLKENYKYTMSNECNNEDFFAEVNLQKITLSEFLDEVSFKEFLQDYD